jgi:hypothetical protein
MPQVQGHLQEKKEAPGNKKGAAIARTLSRIAFVISVNLE